MHTIRHHLNHWWIYQSGIPWLFGSGSIEAGLAIANQLGIDVCNYKGVNHAKRTRWKSKA
jgi:hypothetical protein